MPTRWRIHREKIDQISARGVLSEIAEDVAADARRIVPVETGALRASIRTEMVDDDTARVSAWGGAGGRSYAIFVERGTSKMSAQPFLRPALWRRR